MVYKSKGSEAFASTMQVALSFLEGLDTARSLSVFLLAREFLVDEYQPDEFSSELKSLGFSTSWYDQFSVDQFRDDYQATVLLSKLPPPYESTSLRAAAIAGFWESEQRNAFLNGLWLSDSQVELRMYRSGFDFDNLRRIIRSLLGRAPSLQTLMNNGAWTEGSSVSLPLKEASSANKCEYGITITPSLAKAIQFLELNPVISQREAWKLVPGNLVDTVPKNITTDRTIAKEPDINSFFQREIGMTIRQRLLRHGIDLQDQTLNQRACQFAQKNCFATLDLKDASNSVLLFCIRSLFPSDWFDLFDVTRSPYGTLSSRKECLKGEAEWFEYQMLSSMGNGFTFELESLLFYAIAIAAGVPEYDAFVYGDDLIVPQESVPRVVELLRICGFSLNKEKSFLGGTFFESCGVYTFFGVDVTPLKIKDLLYGNKERIVLGNKIRMFAHSCGYLRSCDKRFLPAWRLCIQRLSTWVRQSCRGPVGSGLTLFCNRNECNLTYSRRRAALRCGQLVPVVRDHSADHLGLLYYRLYEQDTRRVPLVISERHLNVVKTVATGGFRAVPLFIEGDSWYDLGPWETVGR